MPDPLQRITAILREHPCCVKSGHEDALAAVLVEELDLTEEVATVPELVDRVEHTQPCALPDHMIASEETLMSLPAPSLCGIAEVHGLTLFKRRYDRCDCDGWDEFWDQVDEAKNFTGLTLSGRSHHRRSCAKHHMAGGADG